MAVAPIGGFVEDRKAAIAAACEALRLIVEEFDRLGMVVAAARASQALDAANEEREALVH